MKAKELPNLLIKKKRVAQLIYGKPGKIYYILDVGCCSKQEIFSA
jgi:hypothetical protein